MERDNDQASSRSVLLSRQTYGEYIMYNCDGNFVTCIYSCLGCLLGGVCVPCVYRMLSGVIVGADLGLCCCGPEFKV